MHDDNNAAGTGNAGARADRSSPEDLVPRPATTRSEEVLRRIAAIEERGRIFEEEMARASDVSAMRTQLDEVRNAVLEFEGYLMVSLSTRLDEIVHQRLIATSALMRKARRARLLAWFWFLMAAMLTGLLVAEIRLGSVSATLAAVVPWIQGMTGTDFGL